MSLPLFHRLILTSAIMAVTATSFADDCAPNDGRRRRPGQIDCDPASEQKAAPKVAPAPVAQEPVEAKPKPAIKPAPEPSAPAPVNSSMPTRRVVGSTLAPLPAAPVPADKPATPAKREDRRGAGLHRSQAPTAAPGKERQDIVPRTRNAVSPLPVPKVEDFPASTPVPDRWRIVDALYTSHWWDPYNRNPIKGDKPLHGEWFFSFTGVSDTVVEVRNVPTPVGSSSVSPGQLDTFGNGQQTALSQNLLAEFVYYKGDTTFRPPDYEFRFIPVFNVNRVDLEEQQGVNANPAEGTRRAQGHVGIQGAFADVHLRNASVNYDFDSIRVGIQPFTNDFRGFLFTDSPLAVRLFGTRLSNRIQYNLAWLRRLEKDTNSGLNDLGETPRHEDTYVANLYLQDSWTKGLTSQISVVHHRNRENEAHYDTNDFIVRPASFGLEKLREYQVTYLGYAADGHFGRVNLSGQAYYALGEESVSMFRDASTKIDAGFLALEPSIDWDWLRLRASLVYASGDKDPFDDVSTGFDAIQENPLIAGADSSYWIRQAVPLIGGGRVALSGRNGLLPTLRSSKDEGQANFTNPGLRLFGLGVDADVLPQLRASANWNTIQFDDTTVLATARNQANVDETLGQDVSLSLTYRPLNNQNIVLRTSYAQLLTEDSYTELFADDDPDYFLLNVLLTY